jgi:hypothetical protein
MGGILFDRPKPTAGCSANGEEVNDINISAFVGDKYHLMTQNARHLQAAYTKMHAIFRQLVPKCTPSSGSLHPKCTPTLGSLHQNARQLQAAYTKIPLKAQK